MQLVKMTFKRTNARFSRPIAARKSDFRRKKKENEIEEDGRENEGMVALN